MNREKDHEGDKTCERRSDDRDRPRSITISLEDLDEVDQVVRDTLGRGREVAASVGESIRDSIRTVRRTRDSVVMVRLSRDSLSRLDELVDAGVANSRSEAAAFLIGEGIKLRSDLFEKIAEQTQIIREARDRLRQLLDEGASAESDQEQTD